MLPGPVSDDTGGVGIGCNASVLASGASYQSLLVWDDSGNIGIASGWNWGSVAGLNLGGIGCGMVFMFSTAETIFDLKGLSVQMGPTVVNIGLSYLRGTNADGTSYHGIELDYLPVGDSLGIPGIGGEAGAIVPDWLTTTDPSFGAYASTTFDVTPLDDLFSFLPTDSDVYSLYFGDLFGGF